MNPTKENIIKAYNIAKEAGEESTCKVLETLYSDIDFTPADNRPVTERIKTFEDALNALGNHAFVNQYRRITEEQNPAMDETASDLIAYLKLRIITAALNEGWEPQFTQDEERWYPWFFLYTDEGLADKSDEWKRDRHLTTMQYHRGEWAGLAYAYSYYAPSNAIASVGSRLCFKTDTLAEYAGETFIDLWMDFNLFSK